MGALNHIRAKSGRDRAPAAVEKTAVPEGMTDARFMVRRLAAVVGVAEQIGSLIRQGNGGSLQNATLHEKMRFAKALAHAEAGLTADVQWNLKHTHSTAVVRDLGRIHIHRTPAPMILERLLTEYYAVAEQLQSKKGMEKGAAEMYAGQLMVARRLTKGYQQGVAYREVPDRLIMEVNVFLDSQARLVDMRVGRTYQEQIQAIADASRKANSPKPGSSAARRASNRAAGSGRDSTLVDLARARAKARRPKGK